MTVNELKVADLITGITASVFTAIILAALAILRRWLKRELAITRAAVFRLLQSERVQFKGILALWDGINDHVAGKKINGTRARRIRAVEREHDAIARWVRATTMGQIPEVEADEEDLETEG